MEKMARTERTERPVVVGPTVKMAAMVPPDSMAKKGNRGKTALLDHEAPRVKTARTVATVSMVLLENRESAVLTVLMARTEKRVASVLWERMVGTESMGCTERREWREKEVHQAARVKRASAALQERPEVEATLVHRVARG